MLLNIGSDILSLFICIRTKLEGLQYLFLSCNRKVTVSNRIKNVSTKVSTQIFIAALFIS